MKKLSNNTCAYLAGFWDGEGTFSITKRPSKKSPCGYEYQPFAEAATTNEKISVWLQSTLGVGFRFFTPRNNPNARGAYAFMITGTQKVIEFIDLLLPYLIIKKKVALELRKYCVSRLEKMKLPTKKRFVTKEEIIFFNQIRLLNHRGKI